MKALVFLHPKRLAITDGYHGFHQTIAIYKRIRGDLEVIGLDDEYKPGDVCWLETPLNPTGEARDIQYYADKVNVPIEFPYLSNCQRWPSGSRSGREIGN